VSEKNVWLITGAGRGLGVDIARAALTAGHAVVATGDVWTSQTVVTHGRMPQCG
jgi:NAD(P)-dependent dehydrogenase (short-subunit alcohol dehydrogenase family)